MLQQIYIFMNYLVWVLKMIIHAILLLLQLSLIPPVRTDIVEVIDYQQQALQNVLTKSEGNSTNLIGYITYKT